MLSIFYKSSEVDAEKQAKFVERRHKKASGIARTLLKKEWKFISSY